MSGAIPDSGDRFVMGQQHQLPRLPNRALAGANGGQEEYGTPTPCTLGRVEATSARLQLDEERGDAWRPWRVINLNAGIAATRSPDPKLMERTFDNLGRRLPDDMPRFITDGPRQKALQNVPDSVKDVLRSYMEKWPAKALH